MDPLDKAKADLVFEIFIPGVRMSNQSSMLAGKLPIWTIFDRPSGYADSFVAKKYETAATEVKETADIIILPLEDLRTIMRGAELTCIGREEGDDAKIVESWI
jgi:hypothetical protein